MERIFRSTSSDGTYWVAAKCVTEIFLSHLCLVMLHNWAVEQNVTMFPLVNRLIGVTANERHSDRIVGPIFFVYLAP